MVSANMKRTHVDTVLGQVWWVLDPLLQMAIYVVLVEIIFNRGTPDYPLFIFAAILPWKWLSISLGSATGSITGREGLIRQVQFPKIVLPAGAVVAGTVSFAISLIALALMYVLFLDRLSPWLLAIPIIALVQFTFSLGFGIVLSAVNTFYRDVQNLLGHIMRLWFYASPGLWSLQDSPRGAVAAADDPQPEPDGADPRVVSERDLRQRSTARPLGACSPAWRLRLAAPASCSWSASCSSSAWNRHSRRWSEQMTSKASHREGAVRATSRRRARCRAGCAALTRPRARTWSGSASIERHGQDEYPKGSPPSASATSASATTCASRGGTP